MRLKSITDKYINKGIVRGGILLLRPNDSIDFIRECVQNNLVLLGVDGFKVGKTWIQPEQDHSNDVDDYNLDQLQFVEATINFIQERKNLDIWFEIVFEEKSDNKGC